MPLTDSAQILEFRRNQTRERQKMMVVMATGMRSQPATITSDRDPGNPNLRAVTTLSGDGYSEAGSTAGSDRTLQPIEQLRRRVSYEPSHE